MNICTCSFSIWMSLSPHYLLVSIISKDKSVVNLNCDSSACDESFLLLFLRFFVFSESNYDTSRCGFLCTYIIWSSLSFLDMEMAIFNQFGSFHLLLFLNTNFLPFSLFSWNFHYMYTLVHMLVSRTLWDCFCCFSFFSSDWIISINLCSNSLHLSFTNSNLLSSDLYW